MSDWNAGIIAEFRASRGVVGGQFEGVDLLLLTTTGARSGVARTNPLGYLRDGDRLLLVASAAGAPRNPDWLHNVLAHPEVTVELGDDEFRALARVADGAERDVLWDKVTAALPGYREYQMATDRVIPVVVVEPMVS